MRIVYTDAIPKIQSKKNFGKYDWNKSVGLKIKFIFDDVDGIFEIVSYDKNILTIQYNEVVFNISTNNFLKCRFGQKIGKIRYKDWIYNEGDCFENVKILERIRNKNSQRYYKYECLICGNVDVIYEDNITRQKHICNVCSGRKLRIGVNDLYTQHPELVDMFPGGKEQMEQYMPYSRDKIKGRCPHCGRISDRYSMVSNIVHYGVYCDCKGGRSCGEKYLSNILNQLNVEFEEQCSDIFCSSEYSRQLVDFIIKPLKLIIEVDGEIGHGYSDPFGKFDSDFGKNKDIDRDAYLHSIGYEVVRIPYKTRKFDELKNSIIEKLSQYFDFSNIDFCKAENFAIGQIVVDVCNFYNKTLSVQETAKKFKFSQVTISKYLKLGSQRGWTTYSAEDNRAKGYGNLKHNGSKSVIRYCSDGVVYYDSAKLAAEDIGVKTSTICAVCRGHKKTAKGFKFSYIE